MSDSLPDVRRVINSFVAQQRQGRVLIGVDDAHLLDGLSAHVVHQLAQTRGPRLVVTVRTGGEEPDAVTALWKDGLLARLDLEPLSEAGTRSLIESTLDGAVDARSAQRFWKLTGGNALFLRQLVKDQVDGGTDAAGRRGVDVGRRCRGVPEHHRHGRAAVGSSFPEAWRWSSTPCRNASRWPSMCCASWCERTDLEAAERMHLVTVERSGDDLHGPAGTSAVR